MNPLPSYGASGTPGPTIPPKQILAFQIVGVGPTGARRTIPSLIYNSQAAPFLEQGLAPNPSESAVALPPYWRAPPLQGGIPGWEGILGSYRF